MAIFPLSFVLRSFPVAAYRKYASPKIFVRPCSAKKSLSSELDTFLSNFIVDGHQAKSKVSQIYSRVPRVPKHKGLFCRFHHGILHPHSCGFDGCLIRPSEGDMGVHPQVFGKPQVFPKLLGLLL